jgi:hypothetical protein
LFWTLTEFKGAKPGYHFKWEKNVGLGYHKDQVVAGRQNKKQEAIAKNKSKVVQAAISAKEKAASLPAAGGDGIWDLKGQGVKDTDVTALM